MSSEVVLQNFRSGMSGLALPIPKYKFPESFQQSSRLTYYGSLFNRIEINRSFYALPNGRTLSKWSREVPESFKFTFKLWKQITHVKGLQFQESDVRDFLDAIGHVEEKKGCLLIQFPASLKFEDLPSLENLLHVIRSFDTSNAWKVAVEFRDRSWYNEDTRSVLDTYEVTPVVHDKLKGVSPTFSLKSEVIYVRFHGPKGDYRGSYDDDFLFEYAGYVREWLDEGKSVYVYFNNTMGSAYDNLIKLNSYVKANSG